MRPIFSIVVPTCDRPYLLTHTIANCLSSKHDSFEVLVSDNYCTEETRRVVERFQGDARLRYVRTTKRLGACDHWDFACRHASGEYIIFNGDDDCISPGLLHKLNSVIARHNPEIISWNVGLYLHPDWNQDDGGNIYIFHANHSHLVFQVNLERMIRNYVNFVREFFPEGTRMCFHRSLAERVFNRTGRLYWPLALDLTAPLLILGEIKPNGYYYIDSCLGFGGRSRISNAAAYERDRKGQGGEVSRASNFYEEHGAIDFWPYHPFKSKAYFNAHAAAFSLARHFYPSRYQKFELNQHVFIVRILSELVGATNANPFISDADIVQFQEYLKDKPSELVESAYTELLRILKDSNASPGQIMKKLQSLENAACHATGIKEELPISRIRKDYQSFVASKSEAGKIPLAETNKSDGCKMDPQTPIAKEGTKITLQCQHLNVTNSFELGAVHDKLMEFLDPPNFTLLEPLFTSGLIEQASRLP